ncbi:hypothetical protein LC612_34935 [Nostoc sp. CHAB 5834]|nr:hypothetical protein [Nostoc sp. CHAB 5834]
MTRLFIAEKPSQAMDIAKVIGVKGRSDGYLSLNDGSVITWAVGHLVALAEPGDYNEAWKGYWKWDQLPMIPTTWKYKTNPKTSKQLTVIKNLLKTATHVVIATDAGREGELIGREILEYCRYKGPVSRFWTSLLTPPAIKAALAKLRPGSETYPLYEAALARSHADFMLGLTGTRAATLASGVRGDYFALGRVQTPTLAMVVNREEAIQSFEAVTFFDLEATVTSKAGKPFKMNYNPVDGEKLKDKAKANELMARAKGHTGPLRVKNTPETEAPQLPYSLPSLQKDANRVYSFTARNTLKLAQALYEKKAISYPRTDCPYLGKDLVADITPTLSVLSKRFPSAVAALTKLGIVTRSTTFDDSKLSDHHGIVPSTMHVEDLTGAELQLYTLISQRYLQTLAPDQKYVATVVTMDANGVPFKATGKAVTDPGWKAISLLTSKEEDEE